MRLDRGSEILKFVKVSQARIDRRPFAGVNLSRELAKNPSHRRLNGNGAAVSLVSKYRRVASIVKCPIFIMRI